MTEALSLFADYVCASIQWQIWKTYKKNGQKSLINICI